MHTTSKSTLFEKKHFKSLAIFLLLLMFYRPAIGGVSPYNLKTDTNKAIEYLLDTINPDEATAEGKGKKKKESGKNNKHEKPALETYVYNQAILIKSTLNLLLWKLSTTKDSNDTDSNDKDINIYTKQSEEKTDLNAEDFKWLLIHMQSDPDLIRSALEEIISADREPDDEKVTCSLFRPRKKAHKQLNKMSKIEETEDSPALIKFKKLFDETINPTNTESTKVDGDPLKNITTDAMVDSNIEQAGQAAEDETLNTPQKTTSDSDSGSMAEISPEGNKDNTEEHKTPNEEKSAESIFEPLPKAAIVNPLSPPPK